jgi:hypothetical protein
VSLSLGRVLGIWALDSVFWIQKKLGPWTGVESLPHLVVICGTAPLESPESYLAQRYKGTGSFKDDDGNDNDNDDDGPVSL